jgi:dihydropyrimidinase
VANGTVAEATVAISEGRIAALLAPGTQPPESAGARRIDASGKVVMPGVIDPHVHFGMYSAHADDFTSVSTAAAFGGVTTMAIYAMGQPDMPARQFLSHWREQGEALSLIDFAMHCRLRPPERGVTSQFDEAFELGVPSFKVFMAYRKQGNMWDDYSLMEALSYVGRRGGIVHCHAENGDLIDYLEDIHLATGSYTVENFLDTRPSVAEVEATFRILGLARLARCPLYVVHMSTPQAIALASQARSAGQPVWIETCPQYLVLTHEDTKRLGGVAKIAPPLRTREEMEGVWRAVVDRTVDAVGSDHAPYPLASKSLPIERFPDIPFGSSAIETMFPVLYSEGVAKGRIDLPRLVELLCEGPAKALGLTPRKGTIAVGADADLLILDPDAEWQVRAGNLHSQAGHSVYDGWTLHGKLLVTMVRGEVVVQDGRLLKSPGNGRYLPRSPLPSPSSPSG